MIAELDNDKRVSHHQQKIKQMLYEPKYTLAGARYIYDMLLDGIRQQNGT